VFGRRNAARKNFNREMAQWLATAFRSTILSLDQFDLCLSLPPSPTGPTSMRKSLFVNTLAPSKMTSFAFCVAVAFANVLSVQAESPVTLPAESGMTSIFNGKDLTGWSGDERLWSVRDGVIHGETTPENKANGNTFLIWEDGNTKNFEVRLSFRCNAANNSGIQYRSKHITDKSARNKWVVRGYQHELRNENKFPNISSFIYDEGGRRGRICLVGEKAVWKDGKKKVLDTFMDEAEFQKLFKLDDWNEVVIIGKGNHIQHFLNGKLVLDFTDEQPELTLLDGKLALQLHAGKPMWAEFKDIRFKSLD
jgi:hypothetical protein